MNVSTILAMVAALAGLTVLGTVWWSRRKRKSPEERERARRLAVNSTGRLTDGILVETPFQQNPSSNPELLFYRYWASGVEYTAAQDISSLRHLIAPQSCRLGSGAAVKYDPRKPSNSIIVCELWSGLRVGTVTNTPPAPRANSFVTG